MCSLARSGDPARPRFGAPNCTGGAVALAFAREGADVLISYLGCEEVDADEAVR
jgi:NAD(P)-dependent dehydrogenase (short-subunit alcohol dehydrogenase family)